MNYHNLIFVLRTFFCDLCKINWELFYPHKSQNEVKKGIHNKKGYYFCICLISKETTLLCEIWGGMLKPEILWWLQRLTEYVCPHEKRACAQLSPVGYSSWVLLGITGKKYRLHTETLLAHHTETRVRTLKTCLTIQKGWGKMNATLSLFECVDAFSINTNFSDSVIHKTRQQKALFLFFLGIMNQHYVIFPLYFLQKR